MASLSRSVMANGISAIIPSDWVVASQVESENESGDEYCIKLTRDGLHAEIELYSVGDARIDDSLSLLKFNIIELLNEVGVRVRPNAKNKSHEVIGEYDDNGTLIFHQFRESDPILHFSARGCLESDLNELRYIFSSIEVDQSTLSRSKAVDTLHLVPIQRNT